MALPFWTVVSVFGIGQLIVVAIIAGSLPQLGLDGSQIDSTVGLMVMSLMVYAVGLAVLLIEPFAVRNLSWSQIRDMLGLSRQIRFKDLVAAVAGWAGYLLLVIVLANLVALFVSQIDINEVQDIGFQTSGPLLDKLYAGIVLVLAAPIVEEIVFRGYLQGNLRRLMPWWMAGIITSLVFGVVHGQVNVGIDTFLLSMVACYLRERTGAIYGGIGLHMIKNGIAYYLLFWAPPWLIHLLGA